MVEQATAAARKRNLEGTNVPQSYRNSFAALSALDIAARAADMGISIPDDNFESINFLRNLEDARNKLAAKNATTSDNSGNLMVDHDLGERTPLRIGWEEEKISDAESFTLVQSRSSKRNNNKRNVVVSRPLTRSQKKASTAPLDPGRNTRKRNKPNRYK